MTRLRIDTELAQWTIFKVSQAGFCPSGTGFEEGGKAPQPIADTIFLAGMKRKGFGSDGWARTTDLGVMNPTL
jgi:hypothetical protein